MAGHFSVRKFFCGASIVSIVGVELIAQSFPMIRWAYVGLLPFIGLGVHDICQTKQAIKRNFPIIGHGRYLLEMVRPEINQYFIESDLDGRPFDREKRSNIYQRAKKDLNTHPFGTKKNLYEVGYEWINHSLVPFPALQEEPRILVGGPQCAKPYSASLFNISAMSYGSLSKNAIQALNEGAKMGGFAHNTGEGGLSPYHAGPGGDLIWQIGTGYFSARTPDGKFCPDTFAEKAAIESVKMIEIKLSQGAKPGHGGILPKEKITPEIAEIRKVPLGQDVLSPPYHTAFSTPIGLLEFISLLRERSGGKPIGFKLCLGNKHEFLAICKAMLVTGILPDFITVDGGEGGTGAAPLEFSDSVGTPLDDALVFIHNALVGIDVRNKIRVIASGKVTSGFHIATKLAMGADMCNSARGMMFALGCIQALQCHANTCPTGVATQNPDLVKGLVVTHKSVRVKNFHHATIHNFLEILGAAGLTHPSELQPWHIQRRVSISEIRHLGELYHYLQPGELLQETVPAPYQQAWETARPDFFLPPKELLFT
jgi:glutamate synthase domain-containing protein 2